MRWLARLYCLLLGLGFTSAGLIALRGVDRSWSGLAFVFPSALLLLWLGGSALVAFFRSLIPNNYRPASPNKAREPPKAQAKDNGIGA